MKIIILKTQSFSDIITNSSSELFVVKGDRYGSAFEDFLYVENIGDLQWYLEQKEILLPEIRKYLKILLKQYVIVLIQMIIEMHYEKQLKTMI